VDLRTKSERLLTLCTLAITRMLYITHCTIVTAIMVNIMTISKQTVHNIQIQYMGWVCYDCLRFFISATFAVLLELGSVGADLLIAMPPPYVISLSATEVLLGRTLGSGREIMLLYFSQDLSVLECLYLFSSSFSPQDNSVLQSIVVALFSFMRWRFINNLRPTSGHTTSKLLKY